MISGCLHSQERGRVTRRTAGVAALPICQKRGWNVWRGTERPTIYDGHMLLRVLSPLISDLAAVFADDLHSVSVDSSECEPERERKRE